MRNSFFLGLARLLCHYPGILLQNREYYKIDDNSKLVVSDQPYRIKKSLEDGEIDLIDIACTSSKEGNFVYVINGSQWYNVRESGEVETRNDGTLRYSVMPRRFQLWGRRIFDYHTHTYECAKLTANAVTSQMVETFVQGRNYDEMVGKETTPETRLSAFRAVEYFYGTVFLSFPSPQDLDVILQNKQSMGDLYDLRIASPFGITEVDMRYLSVDTVEAYRELHKDITLRILAMCPLEQVGERKFDINTGPLYNQVNKEMEGKLILNLRRIETLL